jgi:hypothetical protein
VDAYHLDEILPRQGNQSLQSAIWIDRGDGPRLTAAMARRGQVSEGGRLIRPASGVLVNDRRGRPRMANPKQAVKLTLLFARHRASTLPESKC